MALNSAKVAVLFGGPSPEHDVSILTGLQALRALSDSSAHQCIGIYWSKQNEFYKVPVNLEGSDFAQAMESGRSVNGAELLKFEIGQGGGFKDAKGGFGKKTKPLEIDCVLNCCHGGPGEDGSIQGALNMSGIKYSGPNLTGAQLGMDKATFGALIKSQGLPGLDRVVMTEDSKDIVFPGPYILKPRFGGSSVGIDVVTDLTTARSRMKVNLHLKQGAVIEPYRSDLFDLQIAVKSWPQVELSAIERPIRSSGPGEILGYRDKYVGGQGMAGAPRELPANVGEQLKKNICEAAMEVAQVAGIRGVARIDFLCSENEEYYVNEVNTIPGSLSRYLFIDPPITFIDLLNDMIEEAMKSPAVAFSATGADGSALRSAGTISAKLA
ncbi:MAG: hypothetical protein HKL80_06020 [Acidimicrobiales bacterium]|nr:hypothetical protein [Acidimicrobiales bacterium]